MRTKVHFTYTSIGIFVGMLLVLLVHGIILGQSKQFRSIGKPELDVAAYDKWPGILFPSLSRNGDYIAYCISKKPAGESVMIVRNVDGSWELTFRGFAKPFFSKNGKHLYFMHSGDSLAVVTLGQPIVRYYDHVRQFRLISQANRELCLIYFSLPKNQLYILNEDQSLYLAVNNVLDYAVSEEGQKMALKVDATVAGSRVQLVKMINLITGGQKDIWHANELHSVVLSRAGQQLAFIIEENDSGKAIRSIAYYDEAQDSAIQKVVDDQFLGGVGKQIVEISRFSTDGSKLFFLIKSQNDRNLSSMDGVKLDVWSYRDDVLQSEQLNRLKQNGNISAVVFLKSRKVKVLHEDGEKMVEVEAAKDSLVYIDASKRDQNDDIVWAEPTHPYYYVEDISSGERRDIKMRYTSMSLDKRYIVGFDDNTLDLLIFDMHTGKLRNISKCLPVPYSFTERGQLNASKEIAFSSWIEGRPTKMLVNDKFDIWEVDLSGKIAPLCVTRQYGRLSNIQFKVLRSEAIRKDLDLILYAFDRTTKDAGFYCVKAGWGGKPHKLFMGPYDFNTVDLLKSQDANAYLIFRGDATNFPNLYWTRDFMHFSPVSDLHPERDYNWLTTQLISFKALDGTRRQGIIYKPENFDRKKKYPIIIHYYEYRSDELNIYRELYDKDCFSIPWMVSHGYIVVMPDILFKPRSPGRSAYESVMGVVRYLSTISWVDIKHIGLQGHSFGAFETNYIVSHSTRFTAAISSSGVSDLVVNYTSIWSSGRSRQGFIEKRQGRMGVPLWSDISGYLENSPVLRADKISTPMLIEANQGDKIVKFEQGLALFLSLRRLGKPVWMLQYDGYGHGVDDKAFIDFTLRSQAFFDFYLKDSCAPKWMVEGIPAARKLLDTGMELEPRGVKPGPGIVRLGR